MNSWMKEHGEVLHATQELREMLMRAVTDADLAYQLPNNPTLGELCRESGEVEHLYIQGLTEFKMDGAFGYKHPDPSIATSVARLTAWFTELDAQLESALLALSEEDLQRPVERGFGYAPLAGINAHIYREALLIFCGRATVYLKALGKTMPDKWNWWVG
jgi:DinB superfamily